MARRAVDELRAVAAALLEVAQAVEAWQLAEHFDVTEKVIHHRVEELRRAGRPVRAWLCRRAQGRFAVSMRRPISFSRGSIRWARRLPSFMVS